MFIRYWAQTDASAAALIALDYCQALLRFAPVRLVSLTGTLEGRWRVMDRLLETSMTDPMINVVCAEQEHWVTSIQVAMPTHDTERATIATGKIQETKVERVKHERELYTAGVRNVLIATKLPTLQRYARAVAKYDAIVAPTEQLAVTWGANQARLLETRMEPGANGAPERVALEPFGPAPTSIPIPITDFRALRGAVLGS